MTVAFATYVCRYARWRGLLSHDGEKFGWWRGFGAYLSGFAFTATPGKVGELIRIRGFGVLGVAVPKTIGAFVFERTLDLIVLLLLSLLAAQHYPAFPWLVSGVLTFTSLLVAAACWTPFHSATQAAIKQVPSEPLRKILSALFDGLRCSAVYWQPRPLAVGLAWGLLAWGLTATSFAWLCVKAGLPLPPATSLGMYPLAMLIGAASLIPGGLGTTEAAIVWQLNHAGAPAGTAVVIAVGVRLATLWFAVVIGIVATAWTGCLGPPGDSNRLR